MARYKIILAYDGTNFHGSQYQTDPRTVQRVLENTLRKLNWSGESVLFAGRTDAGVHASGQVAAFDLDWNHPIEKLQNALNALLPDDVSVRNVWQCDESFHPRFDAVNRSYRYRILCQPVRDPLRERYAWRVWPKPKVEVLQNVAKTFIGVHDFSSFGTPTRPGGSTIRDLSVAKWSQEDDELVFTVTANAFLYHMVRRLVYVQVRAGLGAIDVAEILSQVEKPQGPPFQGLAPSQGLTLVSVEYP